MYIDLGEMRFILKILFASINVSDFDVENTTLLVLQIRKCTYISLPTDLLYL